MRRFALAWGLVMIPILASAQRMPETVFVRQGDSVAVWHPCLDAARCPFRRDSTAAQRRESGTALFIGGSALIVASNAVWQWDVDHGGYPNRLYLEKDGYHFAVAALMTQTGIAMHVRPVTAVLWTSVIGIGFEMTQGKVNGYDIAADVTGAVTGALLARWLR
jgi:hypothetical protein